MDLRKRMLARLPKNSGQQWYEIRNADGDRAVVRIYEEIGYWGVTAEDFAREVEAITAPEIEVQLNSPGGDVFDGIAIFNLLRAHDARIITRVDGLAASAASVIAQAGDQRIMVEASQMMIHEAWGLAIGPADEIRAFADLLDRQNEVIANIYASRSDGDAKKFRDLMAAETWLTHDGAVELGLADEVLIPPRQAAGSARPRPSASAPTPEPAPTPAPAPTPEPAPTPVDDERSALIARFDVPMFGSTSPAD